MKAFLKHFSPRTLSRRGFTILELLVAITILSVLVVLLLSMLDNTTKLWRTNENRVESYREARAAL
ncbi:MAG: type II secretion system protein, partial [Chthoniobacterales bacterium]